MDLNSTRASHPAIFEPPADVIDRIVQAVQTSPEYLSSGPIVNTSSTAFVTVIDSDILQERRFVKCGANVTIFEALVMAYVRSSTTIPVPKLHAAFCHKQWTYIVMEYIEAETLDNAQWALSSDQLDGIAWQLKGYILQLRALGSPSITNHYGTWPDGPFRNVYFRSHPPPKSFPDMDTFYSYWVARLTQEEREELAVTDPMAHEQSVLTRGDLSSRNILVKGDRIVAILDWETFGWYPQFWEHMAARRGAWYAGWIDALERTFGKLSSTGGLFLSIVHSALTVQYS